MENNQEEISEEEVKEAERRARTEIPAALAAIFVIWWAALIALPGFWVPTFERLVGASPSPARLVVPCIAFLLTSATVLATTILVFVAIILLTGLSCACTRNQEEADREQEEALKKLRPDNESRK